MRLGIHRRRRPRAVSVRLGAREAKEDWLELGRDLTARGLTAPRLVVADGAPGLISAIEEIWPRADRQHCAVHRLRNLLAKLPKAEQNRIRFNYWSALTDATSVKDGKLRLKVLISELEHGGYESAARCLADDLDALVVLFLDAIYLPVRPSGPKEGVICAWGIDENGHRELVSVRLGAREAKEDWSELARLGARLIIQRAVED